MSETATGDEKLPTESVTASWIELDPKNGKSASSSGSEGLPQSDTDSNGEAMTAELADASRSLYNSSTSSDVKSETVTPPTVEDTSDTPTTTSTLVPQIATILVTASVCLIIGFLIGRKLNR